MGSPNAPLASDRSGGGNPMITVAQAQALLGLGHYAVTVPSINFNASGDVVPPITIPLPSGFSTYLVEAAFIANASAPLTGAAIGLFTAPGGGGVAIIPGGTAVTVSSTSANAANNTQQIAPNTGGAQSFNAPALYFRVTTPTPGPATATLVLFIRALF